MEPDPASTTGALLVSSNGYNYVENTGTVNASPILVNTQRLSLLTLAMTSV